MSAERKTCCAGAALTVASVFVPKCSLCVAAYFSLFGLSTAAATPIAPIFGLLAPIGLALLALSLARRLHAFRLERERRAATRQGRGHAARAESLSNFCRRVA
jgi:hypothetical protein